jgi:poly-gamma-glutamate synthesis protein (capsule biosynthesis protein)
MYDTLTLVLSGDSMITRRVSTSRDAAVTGLIEHIRGADAAFTNLEVLPNDFRGHPAQESGGTHLAAHHWVVDDLHRLGFDLFATATNHALDYSIAGLLATIETLEAKGVAFAGLGRNLAEARMPVYLDTPGGSVALLSCCSSFAKGQQAGEQRPDMPGRPGLNPLRYTTTYEVTARQIEALREVATDLGLEALRQERIRLGFAFPPDDAEVFPFLDASFRASDAARVRTTPNDKDAAAIAGWVREARSRADVVVLSLHAHEQGATKEDPAEFIPGFCRRMIDEGADVVVGHGPHLLRGMELHAGKPIFYSLGNFIAQNDLVYKLPADAYERFRVDPSATPHEISRQRSADGTRGFPADARYWQTVVPTCRFAAGALASIELLPVALGYGQPPHRRGRPRLASGSEAREILERFATLSQPFGTRIELDGERASVMV